ncbi:MAG: hypothetical protein JWO03_399 [Bacteroidetes bacterium]|nr:hypothetical protein [Bacteroidota bacterium]
MAIMKKFIGYLMIVSVCCFTLHVSAQTTKKPAAKKPVKSTAVKPKTVEPPVDLTIQLVNDCTKNQMIYAGPKKDLFTGKYLEAGGVSHNTIYVKSGDVVCIMNDKKSVKACTDAKKGTSKIEINESGNGFVK